MISKTGATWRFAPTGGGAEQGNSPGQQYFVNDAVRKTVRELLQNCIDNPAKVFIVGFDADIHHVARTAGAAPQQPPGEGP